MASSAKDVEMFDAAPKALLLKPTDAARELGVGRQFMYDLIEKGPDNGGVASIRMARKILVPRQALLDWVAKRMKEASGE
jgi:excisionase family DNA binding protein